MTLRASRGGPVPPDHPAVSAAHLQRDEAAALTLYRTLRDMGEGRIAEVAEAAGLDAAESAGGWRRLDELGLIRIVGAVVEPVDPDAAMAHAMDTYNENTARQLRDAHSLRRVTESLMTVFRPAVARDSADVAVERLGDRKRRTRTVRDLNAAVLDACDSMHPGPMPPAEALEASLDEDAKLTARGIRVRVIYPESLLRSPKYTWYLHRLLDIGVEVRLLEHSPFDILLFDRHTACVPGDPERPGESMLLIRGSALLKGYTALYEDYWLRASPVVLAAPPAPAEGPEVNDQERTVIRLMASGLSDDQIARKMGVHRRTVQRAVAKLMDRLNASSRFEAGLKLARDPALMKVYPLN
ncbi:MULTISPECIES: LuxR C-terminal-related transcriptional regulator [unclassified Streptomyces]|uniref:helix-turn-helix transcriptional regulator n=1 Tax=unclassified Streptomyces TaxID=2593676 RepID=UPI0036E1C4AA